MIILRVLSVLIGALIALLAPQFALDVGADIVGHSVQPNVKVMALALSTVALCASGFLFVGFGGHRLTRSPWKRLLTGVLLLFPAAGCAWIFFFSSTPPLVWMAGPLLCFTGLIFGTFSFPAVNKTSRRSSMRPRDYDDTHQRDPAAD
jgi:hypothetical protein